MIINTPIAVAEIFDKISILEIKIEKIEDSSKIKCAKTELDLLMETINEHSLSYFFDQDLYQELKKTNLILWHICEKRRDFEIKKIFDTDFITESRLEYQTNDMRARIKAEINIFFKSGITEVKSYKKLSFEI